MNKFALYIFLKFRVRERSSKQSSIMEAQQWVGKVEVNLSRATAEEAWMHIKQFSSFHVIFPSITTCSLMDGGIDGTPGCIRQVSNSVASSWAKEKLTSIDHDGLSLSYEVTESNMGFGKYVAVMTVRRSTSELAPRGCAIEWRFEADPIPGMTRDDLVCYLQTGIRDIGRKIEQFSSAAQI